MLAVISNQHLIIKKEEAGGNESRAFLPARLQYKAKYIFSSGGVPCAKMMDNVVVILIGAGVCCVVIGFALFVKLCKSNSKSASEEDNKKLLDENYMENFQECFNNTENIEETLEQLTHIYIDNQYMYNLIVNAIDYIKEGQGDYETALEEINVDNEVRIMKMHNDAIKKSLNLDTNKTSTPDVKAEQNQSNIEYEQEVFEEDQEDAEDEVVTDDTVEKSDVEVDFKEKDISESDASKEPIEADEDDLDDFKIG